MPGETAGSPDPAADRRFDFGIGKLDLSIAEVRLGLHDRGLGLTLLGGALVELSDWGIALAGQLGSARQLLVGIRERRLRRGELGLALVDRGFERLLLDREDHLALFDLVAVLEQAGTEEALHTRPQIDLFERLGAPDELGLLGHRAQLGRLDQHRRRRPGLLGKCGRESGQGRKHDENEREMFSSHDRPQRPTTQKTQRGHCPEYTSANRGVARAGSVQQSHRAGW